jgi:hypothetical protein
VPQKPQRPFVPHRTPTTPRPAITVSEFRLSPPFVPGSGRETGPPLPTSDAAIIAESESPTATLLRPIEDFLDSSPEVVAYNQDTSEDDYATEFDEPPDELPPVEHFIDELPGVDHFAPEGEAALQGNGAPRSEALEPGSARSAEPSESGWLETEWQHFDWRAAAALGETASQEASTAWATTDWGGTVPKVGDQRHTAADAIASALDEIAKRIREGDLAVPGSGPMADPVTIAATLAALLGVKR